MTLRELRTAARRRWGRATPYRLGLLAGAYGTNVLCPYPWHSTAGTLWRDGKRKGAAEPHTFTD